MRSNGKKKKKGETRGQKNSLFVLAHDAGVPATRLENNGGIHPCRLEMLVGFSAGGDKMRARALRVRLDNDCHEKK